MPDTQLPPTGLYSFAIDLSARLRPSAYCFSPTPSASKEFWDRNKDLGFAVCDDRASYDTFVIYGKDIVFDYQMLIFLFAQSRALVVGRTISQANQFDVHQSIVRQFVEQGPELNNGPLALLDKKAIELGLDKASLEKMYTDPTFERRQVTLFGQAIYFLVMHERCHVGLDHGTAKLGPAMSDRYTPTIKGTAEYFDSLLVNQASGAGTK